MVTSCEYETDVSKQNKANTREVMDLRIETLLCVTVLVIRSIQKYKNVSSFNRSNNAIKNCNFVL